MHISLNCAVYTLYMYIADVEWEMAKLVLATLNVEGAPSGEEE